jgi:hypothetical protein
MSGAALAASPCSGVVITDVVERASGELTPVGERCYERAPGVPYYYDAPATGPRAEVEDAPVTQFDASVIQALGAQPIEDVANPFPAGQGEANFRPE